MIRVASAQVKPTQMKNEHAVISKDQMAVNRRVGFVFYLIGAARWIYIYRNVGLLSRAKATRGNKLNDSQIVHNQ
jgi:hypothetical protein